MTFTQRLQKTGFSFLVFTMVWLAMLAWDYRGVPPRVELESMARGFGIGLLLVLTLETIIHLVRRLWRG